MYWIERGKLHPLAWSSRKIFATKPKLVDDCTDDPAAKPAVATFESNVIVSTITYGLLLLTRGVAKGMKYVLNWELGDGSIWFVPLTEAFGCVRWVCH